MIEGQETQLSEEGRRDFLRKSAYAAYATPVITGMLVEKASAAKSWNSGAGEITPTGSPPDNAPLGPDPALFSRPTFPAADTASRTARAVRRRRRATRD